MKRTTLQFEDLHTLHEFIQTVKIRHYTVDKQLYVISAMLTEADLELAVNGFGARVVEQKDLV